MNRTVDNRDATEVIRYLEARVEALKRENQQLHMEVRELQKQAIQKDLAVRELIRGGSHV